MGNSTRRRLAVGIAAAWITVLMAFPGVVAATINGGCTATGMATSSGSIDLTTETVWNVQSTDTLSATGSSPVSMRSATVSAYALGIAIPIRSGTGDGDTTGSIDGVSMGLFSSLGKVFVIAGNASGDGACDGQILVVIDDVDALFTILGGGGLALAILGLAAVLMATRSKGCAPKLLAMIFGGLGAAGLGLSLEQFQVISPTTPVGLAIVVVGALLGFVLAGRFAFGGDTPSGPVAAAAPAPTPPPTPTAAPPQAGEARWVKGSLEPRATITPPQEEMMDAVDLGAELIGEGGQPPESEPPSQPADDYGPDNRPVGGGGPI